MMSGRAIPHIFKAGVIKGIKKGRVQLAIQLLETQNHFKLDIKLHEVGNREIIPITVTVSIRQAETFQ